MGAGRGARGRSRLKTQCDSMSISPGVRKWCRSLLWISSGGRALTFCFSLRQSVYVEPFQPKEEEENSMHNTVVMFSTSDHFTLKQVQHTHLSLLQQALPDLKVYDTHPTCVGFGRGCLNGVTVMASKCTEVTKSGTF